MAAVEFKAFITNLGKYNEGELVGEWVRFPIDESNFNKILNRIGIGPMYEEWFVTDYECDLDGFDWQELGEYPSYEDLQEFGMLTLNITDVEAVDNAYEVTGNLKEAIEGLDNGDLIFHKGINTNQDWGYYIVDEIYGGIENLDIDTIERFFDYEALGRELNFDNYGEDDEETAGEYWCGDEDASDTEIGEAYVEDVGIAGVANPENYFDYEEFGRDNAFDGMFTKDGFVEDIR
jgi:antirestriction protein